MHNASSVTRINYWWNCGEWVWWPCCIWSIIWFQNDFWETSLLESRAASQRLGILRKSWKVFQDRLLLRRCILGFALPVLEYCSKLLDHVSSGASFLTGDVFECDLAHRRSVAVMVKKIILGWLDSAIQQRKRACDDVTTSQILVVLRCCVWLLVEMLSSYAVFGLNNHKFGVNLHLRFFSFPKKNS